MVGFVGFWGLFFVVIFALHLYMTKIGKDFVFSLNFLFLRNGQSHVPYRGGGFYGTGKSRVPYRVRYGRTTVRNIPLGVPCK